MMRDDPKRLSDVDEVLNDAAVAKALKARRLTRRGQAMLAAAGQVEVERQWAIIGVARHRDNDVDNMLSRCMIEHWLPLRRESQPHHGGRKGRAPAPIWTLAWPGYLFVKIADTADAWHGIRSVKHVKSVLGVADNPFFFDDAKFMTFKAELATLKPSDGKPETLFIEGEMVTVIDGPFASFPGCIDKLGEGAHERRARVEVMIFGRVVPVELDLAQIEKRV